LEQAVTISDTPATSPAANEPLAYDPHAIEGRWRPVWDDLDLDTVRDADIPAEQPRTYVLDMFPYPSGDLHIGHAEAFSIGDVVARYWSRRGHAVLHPIGWDAFGLPAENAAIARGLSPRDWTYANMATQEESFRRFGISFDWTRKLATCDPDYYRWTQWLFLRFLEKGLAERRNSPVNWCPKDQTVLANEQVVDGKCERCGTVVTKRSLTQWYLKITDYADRLLDDMDSLVGKWPAQVLTMQRNWIGRSTGAEVDFSIENRDDRVTVYTTRPDTLHGATFFVVAADSDLAVALCSPEQRGALAAYREEVAKLSEIDRQATDREKTGVPLGNYAVNPINDEKIPIWAADYVLADYGTGAIMAVPAHDQRDLDFARRFDLPVRVVVSVPGAEDPAVTGVAAVGEGVLVNSGDFDGMSKTDAIAAVTASLAERGLGRSATNYRLRDWLMSRQRYWGCPIPVVHCPVDGIVPVPDEQLPVELPPLTGEALLPKGTSPLGAARDWIETTCPRCGGPAERDSDTMDTFVDSSWYYYRYTSPGYTDGPFDSEAVRRWLPVAQYVGGVEHAILHLLYARFFTKVLCDLGLVEASEPFASLLNQGQVINGGKAMSKSLGNGINLQEQLAIHGVDVLRMSLLFAGPPEDDIDWADMSPSGMTKQLARMVRVAADVGAAGSGSGPGSGSGSGELATLVAHTIDEVTKLTEGFRFNVACARLMTLTNALRKAIDGAGVDEVVVQGADVLTRLLSVYAPYTAEECWSLLGHDVGGGDSVHRTSWPEADPALLVSATNVCVVQVAGKVKAKLTVAAEIGEVELRALALADEGVVKAIDGRAVRTVIVRAPKLVNVVLA
jgi:leucyl-tRNA synthetase